MNMNKQREILKEAIKALTSNKIDVTGVYMPTNETDAGIEISNRYVLQIAPYYDMKNMYVLDPIEAPGEEIAVFSTIDKAVEYLLETK